MMPQPDDFQTAIEIFLVFFKIGWISLGGVFGVLPELERILVLQKDWITHDQFIQAYVLGQFVPGPNMAICPLIGFQVLSWTGWVAGFFGIYTVPLITMGGCYKLLKSVTNQPLLNKIERALRPTVIGLLTGSLVTLWWVQTTPSRAFGFLLIPLILLLAKRFEILLVTLFIGLLWMCGVAFF